MILYVCALYCEAKPYILKYDMKRVADFRHYQLFEGDDVRLLLTGVGAFSAACALTEALSTYHDIDFVANVGSAGAVGDYSGLYRIDAIRGDAGDVFPDVYVSKLRSASLKTVAKQSLSGEDGLVDMEALGIYMAGKHFLRSSDMVFVKFVSDNVADDVKPDAKEIERLSGLYLEDVIREVIDSRAYVDAVGSADRQALEVFDKLKNCAQGLTLNHPLSQSMERELMAVLRGIACTGRAEDAVSVMDEYAALPAVGTKNADRKNYAHFLDSLKKLAYAGDEKGAINEAHAGAFTRIYVEKGVEDIELTRKITEKLKNSRVVGITNYKEVFNRSGQNYRAQKTSPSLILAKKPAAEEGGYMYRGAPVCQDFGNANFYYVSMIKNCVFDCEYCYLAGMYPGANIVAFVNVNDYFDAIAGELLEKELYLCVSFDTDMLALESILGYGKMWCEFATCHPNCKVEIRTKSNAAAFLKSMEGENIPDNVILAWTLSPTRVIDRYEHHTASLEARLAAMRRAHELGFKIRACFDPAMYMEGFEGIYEELMSRVFEAVKPEWLEDASIGAFRMGRDYLKNARQNRGMCAPLLKPYELKDGVYSYPEEVIHFMTDVLRRELTKYIDEGKIFSWEE
ncbi:MAG: hypothetical protein K6F92_03380 [Lachnospiraceae bacterium]|nr:hypothetical protein [Lachnospiraceae bacterium]